jgi:hypothetical protein
MSDAYSGGKLRVLIRMYEQSLRNCQTQLKLLTVLCYVTEQKIQIYIKETFMD